MNDQTASFDPDDWLTAAEALRRVEQVMNDWDAKEAIARRAFDGLVRARAERFVRSGVAHDDVEVPTKFWWAGAAVALKQNWVAGDFSTYIDRTYHWKAYGVRFHRYDIQKMLPAVRYANALKPFYSASAALERLVQACGDRDEAAKALFSYARVGAIPTRVEFVREETEIGDANVETARLLEPEDWRGIEEPSASELTRGILRGTYRGAGGTTIIELVGIGFDPETLDRLALTLPAYDAPAEAKSGSARAAGRPKAEWWDDLLIEMFRRLWEGKWSPRNQAELVSAMHEWLASNPGDDPDKPREASDTALKARAKKMFDVLEIGQK
jgi:hypothetical protein